MIQKVKDLLSRTKESINGIGKDPINNLGFLIPVAICFISIISGIVTYIMFIVNGGYTIQVDLIKRNGLNGISEGFTSGTTEIIISGFISKILLALAIVEMILILVNYFKNRSKKMRVAIIVDLVVMGIVIAISIVDLFIAIEKIVFSEEQIYYNLGKLAEVTINPRAVVITYLVVTLVSVLCFIVFILSTAECRWMVGYTVFALVFANVAIPSFFLILQNIIPLVSGIVTLVIIGLMAYIFIKVIASDSRVDSKVASKSSSSIRVEKKTSKMIQEQKQAAIYDINRRYKEGCEAIVKNNNDNGAWINSEKTNREKEQLRNKLKKEAALKGVEGKVSIY